MNKKLYAMITGASGEIGSAIARELALTGYDLTLLGNQSGDSLEEIAQTCRQHGSQVETLTGDLRHPNTVRDLIHQAMKTRKNVDLLVNCAGISFVGLLTDMSSEDWANVMDTNLSSVFYVCRLVLPYMVHNKSGRIINISSLWGNTGASCEVAYSASKGGLNAFTRALAKELAPSGISVNALACGMIDTKMNDCFSEKEKEDICHEIPIGRMGTPKEVAQTVTLLSKAPLYLTGQIITLDGGWY